MSFYNHNILQIYCNINFALIKRKKTRVFGTYKALRYSKLSKPLQKHKQDINSNLNKWIVSNEINLKYNSLSLKDNYIRRNNYKSLSFEKLKLNSHKRNSIFKSKKQINLKKKNTSTFKKKIILIKPILVEDNIFTNDINMPKNDIFSFGINNINSYKFCNYHNWYNNYYNIKIYNGCLNNNNFFNTSKNDEKINLNFFQKEFLNNYNNKNITENLYSFSNSQDKSRQSAFYSDNTILNNLRIPLNTNINSNFFPFSNNDSLQFNNSQLIEPKSQKKSHKPIFQFKKEKRYKLLIKDNNNNSSIASSTAQESLINIQGEKGKESKCHTNKGRKLKNSDLNCESKHTKYSPDNMMRKIKNKVIESSRLLINKIIKEEFKKTMDYNFPYRQFRKIQGAFSQELNIKYNFWFYQFKIKNIFCLEISNKYSATNKLSNKELIDYLYSNKNNDKFIKTKKLLDMPFHQYYHDIFLGEDKQWKKIYGIDDKDNIYEIKHLLKNLEEEEEKNEAKIDEKKYVEDINLLALNYESFFLNKKPRNLEHKNKKNEFIKQFMLNLQNDKYLELEEKTKKLKEYYEKKKNNTDGAKNLSSIFNNETKTNEININKNDNDDTNRDNNNNIIKENQNINLMDIFKFNEKENNYYNINCSNISLKEEEKKLSIQKNTFSKENNIIHKLMNNYEKEKKEKHFCSFKRKLSKIKYFL